MNPPDFLVEWPAAEVFLTGHRIGLPHVVDRSNEGLTAEGIAVEYPTLSLAHIDKTLGFFRENRAEVDAYVAECRAQVERAMAPAPRGPRLAGLRIRLEARRRAETAWRGPRVADHKNRKEISLLIRW